MLTLDAKSAKQKFSDSGPLESYYVKTRFGHRVLTGKGTSEHRDRGLGDHGSTKKFQVETSWGVSETLTGTRSGKTEARQFPPADQCKLSQGEWIQSSGETGLQGARRAARGVPEGK